MYKITNERAEKIEPVTFAELSVKENDLEEMLRNSIEILCDDEESLLIVGRQVKNAQLGRSDLTAVDHNGNVVLIEIKRDKNDIVRRKEGFEFQAIRYAASYATIETVEVFVRKVYAPYIEKYRHEFNMGSLTTYELGVRILTEFLESNGSEDHFNKNQKVILVASEFDEQTLSAVAWLNKNGVDMTCIQLTPYRIDGETYLDAIKLLPLVDHNDYYVDLMDVSAGKVPPPGTRKRKILPKINDMLQWGVVKAGDILQAKGYESQGKLLENGHVLVDGIEMSLQKWLQNVFGWASVHTYVFVVHQEKGKTLSQIRKEYMDKKLEETTE